jgi:hypothetical protein
MDDDASNDSSTWRVATIALGMIAVGACAYSFMLYRALSTDLADARIDGRLAHNEVVNLMAQLNSTEAQANAVHQELLSTRARLAAQSRRDLPIRLSFRDAVLRPGKVAVLRNSADADLEVVLDVHSTVSGEHVRRPLVITAHGLLEIGVAQGWQFAPGQIVTLENDHYRPIVRIIS